MRKRLLIRFAIVLLASPWLLVVWQGSFHLEVLRAGQSPARRSIFWAISILIFVLMVTLGWILFRTGVKLYVERQANARVPRIRTKLVVGALALSIVPVFFLVLFSYEVLNHNMKAWFTEPAEQTLQLFVDVAKQLRKEMRDETGAQAAPGWRCRRRASCCETGRRTPGFLERFCQEQELASAAMFTGGGRTPAGCLGALNAKPELEHQVLPTVRERGRSTALGSVGLTAHIPLDVAGTKARIEEPVRRPGTQLLADRKTGCAAYYIMLMALITLFVLFVATWIALFLAKQISVPITALLEAASEVRNGNLSYRVKVRAADELASLVRGFNQMTQELEANSRELDRRRRFTEAILESIPTGVISIGSDGSIQRVNRALRQDLSAGAGGHAPRAWRTCSRARTRPRSST